MKHLVFVQIKQLQIYVDTDDSVNNDGGVNEGNQLSPDEKLFIDVLVRSESESLEDRPHVQTSSKLLTDCQNLQVGVKTKLHQGSKRDLCGSKGQPQEGKLAEK